MSKQQEAMRLALEALEGGADSWQLVGPAIDALKEALVEDAMQKFTDVNQELEAALGCDHCNQPLYASVKCRVCGRVTSAEPVQEPVAWVLALPDGRLDRLSVVTYDDEAEEMLQRSIAGCTLVPLYPAPRKPLTEEEIKACEKQAMVNGALPFEQRVFFARAVERAHGIGGDE